MSSRSPLKERGIVIMDPGLEKLLFITLAIVGAYIGIILLFRAADRSGLVVVVGGECIYEGEQTLVSFLGNWEKSIMGTRGAVVLADGKTLRRIKKKELSKLLSAEELKIVQRWQPNAPTICVARNNELAIKTRQTLEHRKELAEYWRHHPKRRTSSELLKDDTFVVL